jgi:ATP-dependent protease ClpP protease subunit
MQTCQRLLKPAQDLPNQNSNPTTEETAMRNNAHRYFKLLADNKGKGSFRAVKTETQDGENVIWFYDIIVNDEWEAEFFGGVSSEAFREALSEMTGPVRIRMSSPGGSVFAAQEMIVAIREYPDPITVQVDALAASAASVIAAAAARVEMQPGAMVMIHNAWTIAVGDKNEMNSVAELLGKMDDQIAGTYASRAGDDKDWGAMMDAETWFTADEALDVGLSDYTREGEDKQKAHRANAQWNLSAFKNAPSEDPAEDVTPDTADEDQSEDDQDKNPDNQSDEVEVEDTSPDQEVIKAAQREREVALISRGISAVR